jgi:hypothetical protein
MREAGDHVGSVTAARPSRARNDRSIPAFSGFGGGSRSREASLSGQAIWTCKIAAADGASRRRGDLALSIPSV